MHPLPLFAFPLFRMRAEPLLFCGNAAFTYRKINGPSFLSLFILCRLFYANNYVHNTLFSHSSLVLAFSVSSTETQNRSPWVDKKGPITHKDNILGSQLLVPKIIMIQAVLFQRMQARQLALFPSATAGRGLSEGAHGLASLLSCAWTFPLLS